jgi:hypothetical protein
MNLIALSPLVVVLFCSCSCNSFLLLCDALSSWAALMMFLPMHFVPSVLGTHCFALAIVFACDQLYGPNLRSEPFVQAELPQRCVAHAGRKRAVLARLCSMRTRRCYHDHRGQLQESLFINTKQCTHAVVGV